MIEQNRLINNLGWEKCVQEDIVCLVHDSWFDEVGEEYCKRMLDRLDCAEQGMELEKRRAIEFPWQKHAEHMADQVENLTEILVTLLAKLDKIQKEVWSHGNSEWECTPLEPIREAVADAEKHLEMINPMGLGVWYSGKQEGRDIAFEEVLETMLPAFKKLAEENGTRTELDKLINYWQQKLLKEQKEENLAP